MGTLWCWCGSGKIMVKRGAIHKVSTEGQLGFRACSGEDKTAGQLVIPSAADR
jgi:hypothetical protein